MSSFKAAPARDIAFGSNLIGAALGGLLEPLSFVTGIRSLLLVVFVLYLVSFFFAPGRKKEG
jgi:site-specific recombinase